jgi:cob(I)alamin adenosyltransferase
VAEAVIRYLNRLSDYLFTLARFLLDHYGVPAVEWKPRMPGS